MTATPLSFPTRLDPKFTITGCLTAALIMTWASTSTAAAIQTANFTLKMSEKEVKLAEPTDAMAAMKAMWDVGSQRRLERNMPWMQVENAADSDANLTEFRITIGDERFMFDDDLMGKYTVLSPTSPFTDITSTAENDQKELVVSFNGGGLAPGETARFKVDIGVDPTSGIQWTLPDFRTVLFDMNGLNVWDGFTGPVDDSDNSLVTGKFAQGSATATTSERLPDYIVVGPQAEIFNEHFRPNYAMEGIDVFLVGGTAVIPEPNAAMLAMLGLVGLGFVAQRRMGIGRRQYAAAVATPSQTSNVRPIAPHRRFAPYSER